MLTENFIFANRYKLLFCQQQTDVYEWWKAEDIKTKNTVLIKCTKNGSVATAGAALLKEYLLLNQVHHPNLLMPLHYDDYNNQSYIVFPFADGLSLKDTLIHEKVIDEAAAINIFSSLTKALETLHQHHILHRNIHPANVFKINQLYVLGHFKRSSENQNATENLPFLAPELFSEQPEYTEKSDVFALAVMMYQLCTNTLPWQGLGGIALLKGAAIPQLPNRFSTNFNELLLKCMALQPKDRPTFQEILMLLSKEKKLVPVSAETITNEKIEAANEVIISVVNETSVDALVNTVQAQPNHVETKSKNDKKWVAILLVLLSISGGVWAYFSFQKNKTNDKIATINANQKKSVVTNTINASLENNIGVENSVANDTAKEVNKYANRKLDLIPFRAETGKYGFRDWRKKRRIKPQYDDVFEFQEHLAAVKQNGAWGFIDTNGRLIIPNIYNKVLSFQNGIATVEKDNYSFKINKKGNCVEGCSTATINIQL